MSTTPPRPTRRVRGLRHQLDEARDIHALTADPLLAAVRAERFRVGVCTGMWVFLVLGLGYTTTGVHAFLAGHLTLTDPLWWGAWFVEPAFAGILITLLRWESTMLTHGRTVTDPAVTRLKRLLLAATLITNVWSALAPATGPVTGGTVFLHIVIPLVVFLIAEVMPVITTHCVAVRDNALAHVDHPTPADPVDDQAPVTRVAPAPVDPTAVHPVPVDRRPGLVDGPTSPTGSSARSTSATPSSAAGSSPVGLPPVLLDRLTTRRHELGRPLTDTDIRDLLKVNPDYARRLAAQLA